MDEIFSSDTPIEYTKMRSVLFFQRPGYCKVHLFYYYVPQIWDYQHESQHFCQHRIGTLNIVKQKGETSFFFRNKSVTRKVEGDLLKKSERGEGIQVINTVKQAAIISENQIETQ